MIDQLAKAITKKRSPLCLGLDTRFEYIPRDMLTERGQKSALAWAAENILAYNVHVMDAVGDLVACVKLESAVYELYGPNGSFAMLETIREARKRGYFVIADIKGSQTLVTSRAYANSYIGYVTVDEETVPVYDADFATVNAFFGTEGATPFIDCCAKYDKGIFVLVKGATQGASQVQDVELKEGKHLYEHIMDLIDLWGSGLIGACGYSEVGAMIGAIHAEQAAALREKHPTTFFLMPAAGLSIADIALLTGCFDSRGLGALICSTKDTLKAWAKPEYRMLNPGEAACALLLEAHKTLMMAFDSAQIHYEGEIDFDS